jgi:hypothetical protein
MAAELTRRRLIAMSALLGSPSWVSPASAQQEKEPPQCRTERKFGKWTAIALNDWASIESAPYLTDKPFPRLTYYDVTQKADKNFEKYEFYIEFGVKPAKTTYNATIEQGGRQIVSREILPKSQDLSKDKFYYATLNLSDFFPDTNNALTRSPDIKINVHNKGKLLAFQLIQTAGFSEALQFIGPEMSRLQAMEKRKECQACFVTTACCEIVGLPDDCFELSTLRAFRDGPLRLMPGGAADIGQYYRVAPLILSAIEARSERHILKGVYFLYVLPCAIAARFGFNQLARWIYTKMMAELEARYFGNALRVGRLKP